MLFANMWKCSHLTALHLKHAPDAQVVQCSNAKAHLSEREQAKKQENDIKQVEEKIEKNNIEIFRKKIKKSFHKSVWETNHSFSSLFLSFVFSTSFPSLFVSPYMKIRKDEYLIFSSSFFGSRLRLVVGASGCSLSAQEFSTDAAPSKLTKHKFQVDNTAHYSDNTLQISTNIYITYHIALHQGRLLHLKVTSFVYIFNMSTSVYICLLHLCLHLS